MLSQSEYFWEKLAEGEWQQRECQMAIIDAFPFIAVSSFGNAPTSAKTAARWGIDDHHTGAKPVIHHQRECLTAPDMMMVLENERYALEIKGKTVVETYANVMLNEAEVTELEKASDAIQMRAETGPKAFTLQSRLSCSCVVPPCLEKCWNHPHGGSGEYGTSRYGM